jgi:hypothetical protein
MIRRRMGVARSLACAALVLAAGLAQAASVTPDWASVADVETIEIVVRDADGEPRERTIWLVVHDGHGYVRAGSTSSWDDGIETHPNVTIRIEGVDYELRATPVTEPFQVEQVNGAFRDKYGLSDAVVGIIDVIGGTPRILRLEPARGMPMGR